MRRQPDRSSNMHLLQFQRVQASHEQHQRGSIVDVRNRRRNERYVECFGRHGQVLQPRRSDYVSEAQQRSQCVHHGAVANVLPAPLRTVGAVVRRHGRCTPSCQGFPTMPSFADFGSRWPTSAPKTRACSPPACATAIEPRASAKH